MILGRFPISAGETMIRSGIIRDSITIAAFTQARLQGLI